MMTDEEIEMAASELEAEGAGHCPQFVRELMMRGIVKDLALRTMFQGMVNDPRKAIQAQIATALAIGYKIGRSQAIGELSQGARKNSQAGTAKRETH
jgi:hypothetical protein